MWSTERYLALVESGVIEEGRGVELVEGQIITTTPWGKLRYLICRAIQRLFESLDGTAVGFSTQPTVKVAEGEVYDPEFVLLRPEYAEDDLPQASDARLVVEVSVSSRSIDLGPKKAACGRVGVPDYWVVDAVLRGVLAFSRPENGTYREERFFPILAVLALGRTLDATTVFPLL